MGFLKKKTSPQDVSGEFSGDRPKARPKAMPKRLAASRMSHQKIWEKFNQSPSPNGRRLAGPEQFNPHFDNNYYCCNYQHQQNTPIIEMLPPRNPPEIQHFYPPQPPQQQEQMPLLHQPPTQQQPPKQRAFQHQPQPFFQPPVNVQPQLFQPGPIVTVIMDRLSPNSIQYALPPSNNVVHPAPQYNFESLSAKQSMNLSPAKRAKKRHTKYGREEEWRYPMQRPTNQQPMVVEHHHHYRHTKDETNFRNLKHKRSVWSSDRFNNVESSSRNRGTSTINITMLGNSGGCRPCKMYEYPASTCQTTQYQPTSYQMYQTPMMQPTSYQMYQTPMMQPATMNFGGCGCNSGHSMIAPHLHSTTVCTHVVTR